MSNKFFGRQLCYDELVKNSDGPWISPSVQHSYATLQFVYSPIFYSFYSQIFYSQIQSNILQSNIVKYSIVKLYSQTLYSNSIFKLYSNYIQTLQSNSIFNSIFYSQIFYSQIQSNILQSNSIVCLQPISIATLLYSLFMTSAPRRRRSKICLTEYIGPCRVFSV